MPQQEPSPASGTHNELSAGAHQVVQARDIHGSIHIQQPRISSSQVPQMLPADITHFTGRDAELGMLDALLNVDTAAQPSAVVISAIAGTAGMGKTALAVHWAHKVQDRFPDGQLYVNLRGYDPGQPIAPEQALNGFLRTMNMPGENIPHGLDAMAGCYRSLLAGRRMLVVLDNAATADQVRPLLPASPTCMVLVTSRSRLSGLVARDGAHRITLDLLPPDQAITLLRSIIGTVRTDKEPEKVAKLAQLCAYLPLALRIAAERVTARPHLKIADLLTDLTIEQDRLETLAADDDETTAVRTVFSWSYRALPPEVARVFRLLGLHSGPNISAPAAAALTDTTPSAVRRMLDTLASVHLIEETGPDRYTFHDLLRAYAAERAATDEPAHEHTNAIERILSWYLHTADAASTCMWPQQPDRPIDPPHPDCRPMVFASRQQAVTWFDDEFANLMAAVNLAAGTGKLTIAWQLPVAMIPIFHLRSRWNDGISANQAALSAARHLQDPRAEYWAHVGIHQAHIYLGRFDAAIPFVQYTLAMARQTGERRGEAAAIHDLGITLLGLERLDEAIDHFQQALSLYRHVGDQRGEGLVLSYLGDALRRQQRFDEALDYTQQGVATLRAIRTEIEEAYASQLLGYLYADLHRLDSAIDALQHALDIYLELDSRHDAAITLTDLGEAHYNAGRPDTARTSWRHALTIADDLQSPMAARIRARLSTLEPGESMPAPATPGPSARLAHPFRQF